MLRTIILALSLLAASPAFAGVGLMCTGPEGISADLPLGGGSGLNLLGAEIKVMDRRWTMDETAGDATIITTAQSASIDDRYLIDFTDPNLEGVLVRIRLYQAPPHYDAPAIGGYLEVVDVGAWPISCDVG